MLLGFRHERDAIDVSVALALAVWRVVYGGDGRSIYATRGLAVV